MARQQVREVLEKRGILDKLRQGQEALSGQFRLNKIGIEQRDAESILGYPLAIAELTFKPFSNSVPEGIQVVSSLPYEGKEEHISVRITSTPIEDFYNYAWHYGLKYKPLEKYTLDDQLELAFAIARRKIIDAKP